MGPVAAAAAPNCLVLTAFPTWSQPLSLPLSLSLFLSLPLPLSLSLSVFFFVSATHAHTHWSARLRTPDVPGPSRFFDLARQAEG